MFLSFIGWYMFLFVSFLKKHHEARWSTPWNNGPVEIKKILGWLLIMKYCRPPWLAEEENFSFQIV